MDREQQLRDLLEADGRYRAVRIGTFYRDPMRDPVEGVELFTGVIMVRREATDSRGKPYAEVPVHPELFESESAECLARFIRENADDTIEVLLTRKQNGSGATAWQRR